jgi:transglutaminase-like putative cysteine protease
MKKTLKLTALAVITGLSVLLTGITVFAGGIEDTIKTSLAAGKTEIDISSYNLPAQQAMDVYLDVVAQNPDLFYVSNKVNCSFDKGTGACVKLQCSYNTNDIAGSKAIFNAELDKIIADAKTKSTTFDKIKSVHDYIIKNYDYDTTGASVTAFDMAKTKKGVCTSYTGITKATLDKLGIKNAVAISNDMQHEWLVVECDGKWYNVDMTWDDPIGGGENITYANFMKSDRLFGITGHFNYTTPGSVMCTDTQYDSPSSFMDAMEGRTLETHGDVRSR